MPAKKVLLLGSTGLLGSAFYQVLKNNLGVELVAPKRSELDLLDFQSLSLAIAFHKPDIVINCAGYNQVDNTENNADEQKLCRLLNTELPRQLALCSKKENFLLIQFSSDYVFDGQDKAGYLENSQTGPINFYGKSKADGEIQIIENAENFLIFRISWLFGGLKNNFVLTMLKLADDGTPISVVSDQFGKPTYAADVAETVTKVALENNLASGIYHLANEGITSWFDFALKIFEISGKDVTIRASISSDLDRPALRPLNSVLVNSKLEMQRPWVEALNEYLSENNLKTD